jgi:hypothetical protein
VPGSLADGEITDWRSARARRPRDDAGAWCSCVGCGCRGTRRSSPARGPAGAQAELRVTGPVPALREGTADCPGPCGTLATLEVVTSSGRGHRVSLAVTLRCGSFCAALATGDRLSAWVRVTRRDDRPGRTEVSQLGAPRHVGACTEPARRVPGRPAPGVPCPHRQGSRGPGALLDGMILGRPVASLPGAHLGDVRDRSDPPDGGVRPDSLKIYMGQNRPISRISAGHSHFYYPSPANSW